MQRQPGAQEARAPQPGPAFAGRLASRAGGGSPLPPGVRAYMEPRLGADLSQVRVHTGPEAARMSRALHAQAFTHRQDLYFGQGRSPGINALTAHELAHVVQQTGRGRASGAPGIQRAIEVRPPGRGEQSAFDRRQELVDRLNRQSAAIQYRLQGQRLRYRVVDAAALTHFDRKMRDWIDQAEVVPLRLITSAGLVLNAAGNYETLLADEFISGYVDLDDLLSADDLSFQSILLHFLAERFHVPRYAQRIGTNMAALFVGAHRAGHDEQALHFQQVFDDPTITFDRETMVGADLHIIFGSHQPPVYQVIVMLPQITDAVVGATVIVQDSSGVSYSVQAFLEKRAESARKALCLSTGMCPE